MQDRLLKAIELVNSVIIKLEQENEVLTLQAEELKMQIKLARKRRGGLDYEAEEILRREG